MLGKKILVLTSLIFIATLGHCAADTPTPALQLSQTECESLRRLSTIIGEQPGKPGVNAGACYGLIHRQPAYFEACRQYPIDFTHACYDRLTPLYHAVNGLNEAAVQELLARGADARKEHLLYWIRFCDTGDRAEICRRIGELLIKHGANIEDKVMHDGSPVEETPLIFHSRARSLGMVELLLKAGANPNAGGQGGCTALDEAYHHNDPAIIRLLEAKGAKRGIRCNLAKAVLGPIIRKMFENSH